MEKEAKETETEVNFNRMALTLYKKKAANLEAEINQQDKEIETAKKKIETYSKFIEEIKGKYPVLGRLDKIYEVLSKKSFATKSIKLKPGFSDDPSKNFDKMTLQDQKLAQQQQIILLIKKMLLKKPTNLQQVTLLKKDLKIIVWIMNLILKQKFLIKNLM